MESHGVREGGTEEQQLNTAADPSPDSAEGIKQKDLQPGAKPINEENQQRAKDEKQK